jgi:hypothetical protein
MPAPRLLTPAQLLKARRDLLIEAARALATGAISEEEFLAEADAYAIERSRGPIKVLGDRTGT